MNEQFKKMVQEIAGAKILVWLDQSGALMIKSQSLGGDPVDMGDEEAEDLATTIAALLDEVINISDVKGVKPGVAYRFSNDLVVAWMEMGGVICVKVKKNYGDSVAMSKEEAMKLANLIMKFLSLS